MTLFLTFCVSVILMWGALHLIKREPDEGCFSNEGAAFVGATVVAALAGLLGSGIAHIGAVPFAHVLLTGRAAASTQSLNPAHPLAVRHTIVGGIGLLVVALGLFASTCWFDRGAKKAWIGNMLLLLAALLTTMVYPESVVNVLRRPGSDSYIGFGLLAMPITAAWIWAIARVTASLNRVPQVTGGYFGMLALALLWMLKTDNRTAFYFPTVACAAIAGAGLATLPRSLSRPGFNLGRPAALTLGYLVALIAAVGLLKDTVLAIVALSSLVFGLPLLDVSFFKIRAAVRGERLDPDGSTRLHEALLRHGISPVKVSLLYLAIAAFLCGLGVYAAHILLIERGLVNLLLHVGFVGCCMVCAFVVFFSLTRILMRRDNSQALPEEVEAFGVRISVVSMKEALDKIEGYIAAGQPRHVVTSDANAILRAQEDKEYASILRRAALITPDGFGVIWGARLLNLPLYERVTGVDMVTGICERAARSGDSIYILGAAPGIAATAAQKLGERFPGLRVAGTEHGFFEEADEPAVVQRIRDAHPDVLFVAFGIPKQEKFIARHLEAMKVPVCLGVGGSFDVYSERLKRAPEYIQRSGLEWLYRVWQEPARWKRLGYVPRFMVLALKVWLFRPRRNPETKSTNAAS